MFYFRPHQFSLAPYMLYLSPGDKEANIRTLKWAQYSMLELNSHTIPLLLTDVNVRMGIPAKNTNLMQEQDDTDDDTVPPGQDLHVGPHNKEAENAHSTRFRQFLRAVDMKLDNMHSAEGSGPTYFGSQSDTRPGESAAEMKHTSKPLMYMLASWPAHASPMDIPIIWR